MNPKVVEAVNAVRAHFAGKPVEVVPDGAGGAHVFIEEIEVGLLYTPDVTWLGFHIDSAHPHSDVYPHYVGRLTRTDGVSLGEAITEHDYQGRPALQLSRRSNRWNPAIDTAANKAERILKWLCDR
ncbi:hypothetical protein [Streptosporangium subroseum]|uniref:hypothetical protein n=1 Tax=Streptosporangium subroseum TaxID=106412 RepID=UPI003089E1ED|nr:hypothetical protein OHB15_09475 [Streptosporangium subroseum]